jgi:hypothetical protein
MKLTPTSLNDRFFRTVSLPLALVLLAVAQAPAGPPPTAAAVTASAAMTPYDSLVDPAAFTQAAVLTLDPARDTAEAVSADLRSMHDEYHVNTVNVYGLEHWDTAGTARADSLFAMLQALAMKIVIRIEAYDTAAFAFRTTDVEYVANVYQPLLQYVSVAGRNGRVAYFALNMPIDDPNVQQRLGGVNSALSRTSQPQYAQALVTRLRGLLTQDGFGAAQLRLGLFYGWDNSYDLPSYASAQPDGYFINNYSYPGAAIADASAQDDVLINVARLRVAIDRFVAGYGSAQLIVEYGFHTVEYNGWVVPGQTAGLVMTLAAKQRALGATTRYYRATFRNIVGTSYFGFNLIKHEGSAPGLMDWALRYP